MFELQDAGYCTRMFEIHPYFVWKGVITEAFKDFVAPIRDCVYHVDDNGVLWIKPDWRRYETHVYPGQIILRSFEFGGCFYVFTKERFELEYHPLAVSEKATLLEWQR